MVFCTEMRAQQSNQTNKFFDTIIIERFNEKAERAPIFHEINIKPDK